MQRHHICSSLFKTERQKGRKKKRKKKREEGRKGKREGGRKEEQAGRERGLPEEPQPYWTDMREDRLENPPQNPGSLLPESGLVLFTERLKSKKAVKPSREATS